MADLKERAKLAKEAYVTAQTSQINKDFFDLFQEIPDTVTIKTLRTATIKIGTLTLNARRYDKWVEDGVNEYHWSFYKDDEWESIKTMEELGFVY